MPEQSHNGRHRAAKHATVKPRRLMAGLALPTAAALTLTFTATGAAVATSTKTSTQTTARTSVQTPVQTASAVAAAAAAARNDPRTQAIKDNALAIARENAGAGVARAAERVSIAARVKEAERKAQAQAEAKAKAEAEARSWQLPLTNAVQSSSFGWRWGRLHAGDDFAVPVGTDLASMSRGTVTFAGEQSGYGTMVQIEYWDGTVSYYAHMSRTSVTEGQSVDAGEIVGQSGNSGHSTGPHLHLEIHPNGGAAVDPAGWLAAHKVDY